MNRFSTDALLLPFTKGGEGSGRYPKGSKQFTGSITPLTDEEAIRDAQSSVLDQAKAQGIDILPKGEPTDPSQHELWLGYRMTYAALSLFEKEEYEHPDAPVSILVAKDTEGKTVGATMIQPRLKELYIHYIGSTHTTSGVGKALLGEVAKVASSQNLGIAFEPELTSVGFWEHEGFEQTSWNRYAEMPIYTMPANQVHTLIQ